MNMRKYLYALIMLLAFNSSYAQTKLDSLQILRDVNGGGVQFTTIAANAVTWGNGFGTNNMAFITSLRTYTTSTLPITLSSFKPVRESNAVKLNWSTSSESNSDYFEILKSTDGKKFMAIGIVKAANNSNALLNYSFKDVNPVKGANYYQLNMVDLDGTAKKSIIVSSNFDFDKADFNVFTDANKGSLSLTIFTNKVKSALFEVYDLLGNKLLSETLNLQNGTNTFEFKLNTNSKMIVVQLSSEGDKQVKKLFY